MQTDQYRRLPSIKGTSLNETDLGFGSSQGGGFAYTVGDCTDKEDDELDDETRGI